MGKRKGSPALVDSATGFYNLQLLWNKADKIDREMGEDYYTSFSGKVVDTVLTYQNHEVGRQVILAVYASLSPNNSEESCLQDTVRAISMFPKEWDKLTVRTYGANKEKARRILQGEFIVNVLRGRKTWSFYHNLYDPSDHSFVTVDGHMVNAWQGKRQPLDYSGISTAEYDTIQAGITELADRKGYVPCAMQAILWLAWRRIHRILYKPQYTLF